MSRQGSVGNIRISYVPSIANIAAPTTAEVTAGTDLTPFMTRDGISTPNSASTTDISDLADRRNKRAAGTFGGDDWTLKLYRDSVAADDDAWTLLEQDLQGFLVVRRFGGSAVPLAATEPVEVAEISVTSRVMDTPGADTAQTFGVVVAVADANDAAVIAA